jgi:hypothetical protein
MGSSKHEVICSESCFIESGFIPTNDSYSPLFPVLIMATSINATLQTAFQDALQKKPRKSRKDSLYSEEEKLILGKYKHEYRMKTTTDERQDLLRSHILVDIFNYWCSKGVVTEDIDEEDLGDRIKVPNTTSHYI